MKMKNQNVLIQEKPDNVPFERIHEILLEAHRAVYEQGIEFSTTNMSGEEIKKNIGEDGICLVALAADAAVGTASIRMEHKAKWYWKGQLAHILHVSVLPSYQGCGIASKLIKEIICKAEGKQLNFLIVATPSANKAAINLYHKFGFELLEYFIYGNHTCVRMGKWLSKQPVSKEYIQLRYLYSKMKTYFKKFLLDR